MKKLTTTFGRIIILGACLALASEPTQNKTQIIKRLAEFASVHEDQLRAFLKEKGVIDQVTGEIESLDSLPPHLYFGLNNGKTCYMSPSDWQKIALNPADLTLNTVNVQFYKKKKKRTCCTIL